MTPLEWDEPRQPHRLLVDHRLHGRIRAAGSRESPAGHVQPRVNRPSSKVLQLPGIHQPGRALFAEPRQLPFKGPPGDAQLRRASGVALGHGRSSPGVGSSTPD